MAWVRLGYRRICAGAAICSVMLSTGTEALAKPWRTTPLHVMATAYCERGKTSSGVHAQSGIVAADPRHLPLGTRLRIVAPGQLHNGTYVVADTGSAINGQDLDIFMASCRQAKAFGKKIVTVRILERGTGAKDARDKTARRDAR
jgi:3D (Asp-Asp-Asp) domain-containing protein